MRIKRFLSFHPLETSICNFHYCRDVFHGAVRWLIFLIVKQRLFRHKVEISDRSENALIYFPLQNQCTLVLSYLLGLKKMII